jgi:hypothetical protein
LLQESGWAALRRRLSFEAAPQRGRTVRCCAVTLMAKKRKPATLV